MTGELCFIKASLCLSVERQEPVQNRALHHIVNFFLCLVFLCMRAVLHTAPSSTFNTVASMWWFCWKFGIPLPLSGACGGPWMAYSYTPGTQWFRVLAWFLSPDGARADYNGGSLNSLNGANLVKSVYCLQPCRSPRARAHVNKWVHHVQKQWLWKKKTKT